MRTGVSTTRHAPCFKGDGSKILRETVGKPIRSYPFPSPEQATNEHSTQGKGSSNHHRLCDPLSLFPGDLAGRTFRTTWGHLLHLLFLCNDIPLCELSLSTPTLHCGVHHALDGGAPVFAGLRSVHCILSRQLHTEAPDDGSMPDSEK